MTALLRIGAAPIAVALMLVFASAAQAQNALSGTWSVQRWSDPGTVQFSVRYDSDHDHSDWSRDIPMSALAGLTRDQLQSAGENVRFDVFVCMPSTSYSNALASRGMSRPDEAQQLRMAMANVTIAFIDMLRRNSNAIKYRPTPEELIRLRDHGVTLDFVKRVKDHGYNATVEQLIHMRDAGIG